MKPHLKQLFIGSFFGILLPFLCMLLFWLIKYNDWNLYDFFRLTYNRQLLAPIISICLVSNLAIFFYFINSTSSSSGIKQAQGVILGSFIWGIVILVLKGPTLF